MSYGDPWLRQYAERARPARRLLSRQHGHALQEVLVVGTRCEVHQHMREPRRYLHEVQDFFAGIVKSGRVAHVNTATSAQKSHCYHHVLAKHR